MKASLFKTLTVVGIVLALTLFRGGDMEVWGSFVLVIATVLFLPWTIYSLIRLVLRPAERRSRGIKLALWTATIVVAFSVRGQWDAAARREVTSIAAAVQAHKARTGVYPSSLSEVGFNAEALKEEISLSYRVDDGKATLFYSQPSMPMIAHHYDFSAKAWQQLD